MQDQSKKDKETSTKNDVIPTNKAEESKPTNTTTASTESKDTDKAEAPKLTNSASIENQSKADTVPSRSASEATSTPTPTIDSTAKTEPSRSTSQAEKIQASIEPNPKPEIEKKNPDDINLSKLHALVVEDNAGNMATIGVMMRYLGVNAYINTTGQGVIEMANAMKPKPDIIFLDLGLPKTSGYEILEKIRADRFLKDVVVVAVTALDADTEIPKCQQAGFNAYIGKPISRMRFPKQVKRIMAGEEVWETY